MNAHQSSNQKHILGTTDGTSKNKMVQYHYGIDTVQYPLGQEKKIVRFL